jgi:O-antigen/teichoic acid export membrane protein
MTKNAFGNKELKNASWIIAGKVFQTILVFVTSVFTTRYLGPSNYGIINYVTAYVSFFAPVCTLGINMILVKDLLEFPEEQGASIGTTCLLRIIASFLSTLFIVGVVAIVDMGEKTTIVVSLLCSLSLVFQAFDTINYWFQSRYNSKITAIVTLVAYIITTIYKIVLLVLQKSVIWFAFASSVDYICLAIFLLLAYQKKEGPKLRFSIEKGKKLLKQSYHYVLSGVMVAIYSQTDKLMLKQMMDETEVGYYSLAASINGIWVFVLQAIIDSMVPTIMRLYQEEKREQFERKNKQLYAIIIYFSIFVAIGFVILGKPFILFVYGEEYIPAASILNIISWGTLFSYLGVARNAWLVCQNKQKYLKYMYFCSAIANVVLNILLIPIVGGRGAAIASVITQMSTSIILPLIIKEMRPNAKLMIESFLLKEIRKD